MRTKAMSETENTVMEMFVAESKYPTIKLPIGAPALEIKLTIDDVLDIYSSGVFFCI